MRKVKLLLTRDCESGYGPGVSGTHYFYTLSATLKRLPKVAFST